jgi:hypothetical protein
MTTLRRALGDDAVILATEEGPDGVRITAGVEVPGDALGDILRAATPLAVVERLALALRFHQAGGRRIERLCLTARESGAGDLEDILAAALAGHCRFAPLGGGDPGPLVLAGGPGVGKTLMVARLAPPPGSRAGRCASPAPTPGARAGSPSCGRCSGRWPDARRRGGARPRQRSTTSERPLVLVDSAAVNPLQTDSLAASAALARRLGGELLPVLPADLMPVEAHDRRSPGARSAPGGSSPPGWTRRAASACCSLRPMPGSPSPASASPLWWPSP